MTNQKQVTGHEVEMSAVESETAQIKAKWDAMTQAEKDAYMAESDAKFAADMAAIGHVSFWG